MRNKGKKIKIHQTPKITNGRDKQKEKRNTKKMKDFYSKKFIT